ALARYDKDADRNRGGDPGLGPAFGKTPQPIGTFGANEHGLLDVAGNVWEWTDTCFVRTTLDALGTVEANVVNCGVRLVEGRHRAYMPDFIRDARAGGCSVGSPPRAIGFRLFLGALRQRRRKLWGPQRGRFLGARPPAAYLPRAAAPRPMHQLVHRQAAGSPRFAGRRNWISLLHQRCAKMQKS